MKRHLCTLALVLVALSFSQKANAHDLIQVAQARIQGWGSWKITMVRSEENFSMTIHQSTNTHTYPFDEDGAFPPFLIDDNDSGGWTIDFAGDGTVFLEVRTVNAGDPETYEVAFEVTHGSPGSPYDDVVLTASRPARET